MKLFLRLYDSFISSQLFGFSSFGCLLVSSWKGRRFLLKQKSIDFETVVNFYFVLSLINTFIHVDGKTLSAGWASDCHLSFIIFLKLGMLSLSHIVSHLSQHSNNVLSTFSLSVMLLPSNLQLYLRFTLLFLSYWFLVPSLNIHITFSSAKDVNNICSLVSLT